MQLESKKVSCSSSPEEIFTHLDKNFKHYKEVMPEEVEHFEADETSFVFGLKGMPHLRLVAGESTPNSKIVLTAASSKLEFDLTLNLEPSGNGTQAWFYFEGQFNAMIQMMVKKPLQQFIDKLADQLAARFSS
jgi:hypothetical protein